MRLVVICIEFFTLEYIFSSQIGHKNRQILAAKLVATTLLNIFLLMVNFDKPTIRLHLFHISFTLAKLLEN